MKKTVIAIILLSALLVLGVIFLAPKSESEAVPVSLSKAKEYYKFNCSMCHGPIGQGNGPTARALPVKPPNWTSPGWQLAVTDAGIKMAIVGGGKSVGRSDNMPAYPNLENTEELDQLVYLIREFGRR